MAIEPDGEATNQQPQDHLPKRKTAAEILALNDTRTDEVYVAAWDTTLKVTGLTKRQQLDIQKASMVDGVSDEGKAQEQMWLEAVLEPHFEAHEIPALFEKSSEAVDTVIKRILELSGMKPEALKDKEAAFRKG